MTPNDLIEWIDTMDVWTLAVFCGWGFWKILQLIQKVSASLGLVEQKLSHIEEKMDKHMVADAEEHRRLYDKIEDVRDRSYGNVASNSG